MGIAGNLIWTRETQDDPRDRIFDLILTNPDNVDWHCIKRLVDRVKAAEGVGKHLDAAATGILTEWAETVCKRRLRPRAFAMLSNWFLTSRKAARESELGQAAGELFDAMFAARPDSRLTDPKRNHHILSEQFEMWWVKLNEAQRNRPRSP